MTMSGAQWVSGATELWRELESHRPRLTAMAAEWGMSVEDAEDIASEVLLRTAAYAEPHRSRLAQILVAVLRQCALDRVQRRADEIQALHRSWHRDAVQEGPVEQEVVGRQYVDALLNQARLSGQEEQVVLLVVAGHPHTEVAGRLGVTAKASQRSLDRARSKLRKALATDEGTGDRRVSLAHRL